MHHFFLAFFFGLLAIVSAGGNKTSGCLEKEKALALLETADGLLSKAGEAFPSCKKELNSTNKTDCSSEKPLAYIEISKKLISDVRENFPKCTNPIEKDDKIVQDEKPKDCLELFENGRNESGVYTIWPRKPFTIRKPLQVYCDMETDDGGWTVIQRRGEYPVQQDFFVGWESYKNGFGNLTEEFWLGNENIQVLCYKGCEIRFNLQNAQGEKGFAHYENFALVGSEYTININGYTGNVGDGMILHNNFSFSTRDEGRAQRALLFKSGWWFIPDNHVTNLNGILQPGKDEYGSMFWYKWRKREGLAAAEMKVRPRRI